MRAHVGEATIRAEIERLFSDQAPTMWRAVLGYSGDAEIAADAVAEAFALALERPETIRTPSAWLWRVAFRLASDELQRRRRTDRELPELAVADDEPALDVLRALGQLSLRQRGAIVLHYYADRPVPEVARILGSTPAAVRVHLMRARRRLRELLEEKDG